MIKKQDEDTMLNGNVWQILARVLERQGIATVFALVFMAGGWQIAEAHLDFLNRQVKQMELQSKVLHAISMSNLQQEVKLDTLSNSLRERIEESQKEHVEILKSLHK